MMKGRSSRKQFGDKLENNRPITNTLALWYGLISVNVGLTKFPVRHAPPRQQYSS